MARTNGAKTELAVEESPVVVDFDEAAAIVAVNIDDPVGDSEPATDPQDIDGILNALKTLLSSVEKLQKVRQEVGDIKPLMVRMLDGEVLSGEELEQLKGGVGGLFRLVRAHSDHQAALAKAQPARDLLDQVLKP
jgi:hypothetical protein